MVKGKYFMLKSKSSGLYLDVTGASKSPGAKVILWSKTGNDNQVWYHHPLTQTIRGEQSNLCLDLQGDRLVINNYQPGRSEQHWVYNKNKSIIESPSHQGQVLDVVGGAKATGTEVCSWGAHGGDNQKWEMEGLPIRYFYIRSATCDKVLDIEGGSKQPGARVILYPKKGGGGASNQLWFEDPYGNIRSKHNDKLVLDASSGVLKTGEYHDGRPSVFWAVDGNKIVNRQSPNEVLDLKGACTDNGTEVCPWAHHGNANQQWHLDLV